MDVPFAQAERYLSKLTASHLSTLNMKFTNQNVLKRILIAMLNKNKADWNENSRICVTEFRQPIQVQSHLEMPGILVQLGHIQRT